MVNLKTVISILVLVLLISTVAFGQSKLAPSIHPSLSPSVSAPLYQIEWNKPSQVKISETETHRFLNFVGAEYESTDDYLPRYSQRVSISNEQAIAAELEHTAYELLSDVEVGLIKHPEKIGTSIQIEARVLTAKKQGYGVVSFIPIRKNPSTGKFEKLLSFDISLHGVSSTANSSQKSLHVYAAHSVLQSGNWYKIAIASDGIYKLSYTFLKSMGIDVTTLDPHNIRVYGNGGGMLPELNAVNRPDDLLENSVYVEGEGDGSFDASDYVLFYGKGPTLWKYDATLCPKFQHTSHLYSDSAYYFITTDLGAGKRIQAQASSSLSPTHTVNTFDDYAYYEKDNVNFIKSGRQWFGEYFENNPTYNFSFPFPDIDGTAIASVKTVIASRHISSSSASYSVSSQTGNALISIPAVSGTGDTEYANIGSKCYSFNPNASSSSIVVNVTKQTSDAIGWLDYIDINVRRHLVMSGSQLFFRDVQSVGAGNVAAYTITSSSAIQVWDVTDISNVRDQVLTTSGNSHQFVLPSDELKQFIAFTGTTYLIPSLSGSVVNQDLHSLSNKNFILVAHPDFNDEALQLAAHHENKDGISTVVVNPQQIYNEFSSGAQDISAIRDFVKMFYDNAGSTTSELPKYLLLFGDGSYDNKKRFSNNSNFIPTYQSFNSINYNTSYVSDDFYGLLDDTEGKWTSNDEQNQTSNDAIDIGIGRFPVRSKVEAIVVVNKILNYTKTGIAPTINNSNGCSNALSASPFGDWRNSICFIGDDEDGGIHQKDANKLADFVDSKYNNYNVDKIYLDAYQQEATPGGDRFPIASEAINKRVEKGCLILNYTGHGGEVGLAHERVLELSTINKWNNSNNLPLFFTATCEFSRYDDPERTSAGEDVLLNPNGGGIGLFTTVRAVYPGENFTISKSFYDKVFEPVNGKMQCLGDLYEYMKTQASGNTENGRKFTLLGDPALTLTYPKYTVSTDTINSVFVTSTSTDTLKKLSHITVSGFVRDNNGLVLNNFNGVLYSTVFDKSQDIHTRSNDGVAKSPPFVFKLQNNIVYRGKVSVINGYFKYTFVVPKDIAFLYGVGRISYYAENGSADANGFYEKIIIGGSNDAAPLDEAGPEVSLFMNDDKFVVGGITNENPDLYATLKDANGINTVGTGIGHDITAVLDANTENAVVLNDYYQADLNSYKSGSIRYPYKDLNEGVHSILFKVWDVYNNSTSTYTNFVVAKSAKLALSHVLNYPNPFTTKTQFYFEQNQCCQQLDVDLQIFTVSGKMVKNIKQFIQAEGFRSDPIEWDGRDDFGDKIGKGVYIYRIKIKTNEGGTAEKYEKLVILN